MHIINRIRQFRYNLIKLGRERPTYIYIGEEEYNELFFAIRKTAGMFIYYEKDDETERFEGVELIKVNKKRHLNIT